MSIRDIGWPGPRPADRLIGREHDLDDLYDACQGNEVVTITAPSGVGKTSFIGGAIPYLMDDDVTVLRGRPWDEVLSHYDAARRGTTDDPRLLYCLALGADADEATGSPGRFLASRAVLRNLIVVFDQLDELLRYRRALGERFVELVGEIAKGYLVRHVVIARSEVADGLRPLQKSVVPWQIRLLEITDPKTIGRIIAEPCTGAVELEDGVVKQLASWWETARTRPVTPSAAGEVAQQTLAGVGLLHLQTLLWSFQQWLFDTVGPDADRIRMKDLNEFAAHASVPGTELATRLIQDAIGRYVRETIDRVTAPERTEKLEPPVRWANGPRLMVARVAPYLSSAGYKIPQGFSSLVPLALQDELAPDQARALRVRARTTHDRAQLARSFPVQPAGIALGWPDVASVWSDPVVMLEMLNSLEAGLNALAAPAVNILRRFAPADTDPIYDLVHDGLGNALSEWAEEILGSPVAVVGLIAARPGQPMRHDLSRETFVSNGRIDPRWGAVELLESGAVKVSGLRWTGNNVSERDLENERREATVFRDIVFDDCDFRGTVFKGIEFHNVRFESCNVQGVAMLDCVLDGVSFTPPDDDPYALDPLVIYRTPGRARVTFENLQDTTGLFLSSLGAGEWSFTGKRLQHVVVSSDSDELLLTFDVADLAHVTLDRAPRAKLRFQHANEARNVSELPGQRVT